MRASNGDAVEIAFSNTHLRDICESRRRASAALGEQATRELEQRLADLAAVATVSELAMLFPEDIIERSPVELAIRLKAGYTLSFCPGHLKIPTTSSGGIHWDRVSRIRIIALEAING